MIRRKFQKIGSSFGIIIPKMIMESLNINPILHDLDMEIEDNRIVLKKIEKKD